MNSPEVKPEMTDPFKKLSQMCLKSNLKITLRRKHLNITKLAEQIGVDRRMVYWVLLGMRTSARVEEALEEVFGMSIEDIRASWRDADREAAQAERDKALQARALGVLSRVG